jgi:hypothetical protein
LIFEYAPHNYARFNYQAADLFCVLRKYGFSIWEYHSRGQLTSFGMSSENVRCANLIATKNPQWLRASLIR